MRVSDQTIESILKQGGVVDEPQLADLKLIAERSKQTLQETAIEQKVISEEDLTKLIGDYIGVPFVRIEPKDIPEDILKRIPEHIARQYNVVLFEKNEDDSLSLAMEDPDDVQALNFIQKEIGYNTKVFLATKSNILDCLENYRGNINAELDEVIAVQKDASAEDQNVSQDDFAENSPIAQTVNLLLEYAIKSNASDIHIEPREDYVQVRYRIDGVLKEVNKLPRNVHGALVSRIKILSNLKIDERRVPQDGRFKIKVSGKQYALRVSTLPIADGEKVVMRILDESNQAVKLDQLGYWGLSLATVKDAMAQPNGMILVTGPTGSGKSTSLFSVLSELNTPDVNISTIEDPVEYKIPGVNQTQTNAKAGMTFASGLRALLRQDPNIIMVGEIRDGETANLGVQAALTGHLVFSTLHTNNAATCLPRLLDMGIEPFLIASTVNTIIGQRLVRRVAPKREVVHSTEMETKQINDLVAKLLPQSQEQVAMVSEDLGYPGLPVVNPNGYSMMRGIDERETPGGFKGRAGLYETIEIDDDIQKMIVKHATSSEIMQLAKEKGTLTMRQDGMLKALTGVTTVGEVNRVASDLA